MDSLNSARFDPSLIERFRARVYAYAYEHTDEIDLEDLRNRIAENVNQVDQTVAIPELMLKRFLLFSKPKFDLDSALQKFVQTFTWRKKYGINNMSVTNT